MLRAGKVDPWYAAFDFLAACPADDATPLLRSLVMDGQADDDVRFYAENILSERGDPVTVSRLIAAAREGDEGDISRTVQLLVKAGARLPQEGREYLAEVLTSSLDYFTVRKYAVDAFRTVPAPRAAMEYLWEHYSGFRDEDWMVEHLKPTGVEAIKLLSEKTQSGRGEDRCSAVRQEAISALSRIAKQEKSIRAPLLVLVSKEAVSGHVGAQVAELRSRLTDLQRFNIQQAIRMGLDAAAQ